MTGAAIRTLLYFSGMIVALIMAANLMRLRHVLAKLLCFTMLAWIVFGITTVSYTLIGLNGDRGPLWHMALRYISAVLYLGIPTALYVQFWRVRNGRDRT